MSTKNFRGLSHSICYCLVTLAFACQKHVSVQGENLWKEGNVLPVPSDKLPPKPVRVCVADDGARIIDEHRAVSLEEGVRWLAHENYRPSEPILLLSESKRLPSDGSLSMLCDLAVQRDVSLYGSWPISGGTLVLSSGQSSAPDRRWSLLVRRRE
jgi:hypothetical protein